MGRSLVFWSWYNFCIDYLWYKWFAILSFFAWWFMNLTCMLLTGFWLYMSSFGEGKKSFIGVALRHSKTMSMLWFHWAAFFKADFSDCMHYSAIHFDCGYFRDDMWCSNFHSFTLLEQAEVVVGFIIANNPFGYSLFSKYLFGHIDNILTGELSVYVRMGIWSSSKQLVNSLGHESGRDQWLQFAMVLLGSHAFSVSVSCSFWCFWQMLDCWTVLAMLLMPCQNIQLFAVNMYLSVSWWPYCIFCIIFSCRSWGIIIQSPLRIPFSIVKSSY